MQTMLSPMTSAAGRTNSSSQPEIQPLTRFGGETAGRPGCLPPLASWLSPAPPAVGLLAVPSEKTRPPQCGCGRRRDGGGEEEEAAEPARGGARENGGGRGIEEVVHGRHRAHQRAPAPGSAAPLDPSKRWVNPQSSSPCSSAGYEEGGDRRGPARRRGGSRSPARFRGRSHGRSGLQQGRGAISIHGLPPRIGGG